MGLGPALRASGVRDTRDLSEKGGADFVPLKVEGRGQTQTNNEVSGVRPALGRVGQQARCAMSLPAAATHARVASSRARPFRAPRRRRATGDAAARLVPRVRGNRDGASATRTRPAAASASSPAGPPPLDLVVFTVIVDDLVFADGATRMGVLGGGGPQTAFGFRTHPGDLSVGLAAGVGPDFPRECADWLDANGVDAEGLMFYLSLIHI